VMACVVGRRQPDGVVEVLRAYLQPCVSTLWLLPVDSSFERRTVRLLVSLQRWVSRHDGAALTVEKPVFDMAAPIAARRTRISRSFRISLCGGRGGDAWWLRPWGSTFLRIAPARRGCI
jgi:hypothetical protein